jgi:hypothetical protein
MAHLAFLTQAVILDGGKHFDSAPVDAITVDIVPSEEAEKNAEQARQAEEAPAEAAAGPPRSSPARADGQGGTAQAAARPQPTEPAREPASPPAWLPPQFAAALPELVRPGDTVAAEMFAMPPAASGGRTSDGYQGPATEKPDIAADAIAAFRKQVKTCSVLPAEVTAKAQVKLRILLNPDGTLMKGPDQNPRPVGQLYGWPNGGGGELFNAASEAVRKCQPYTGLPSDKYDEWKTLEITFTRQNF